MWRKQEQEARNSGEVSDPTRGSRKGRAFLSSGGRRRWPVCILVPCTLPWPCSWALFLVRSVIVVRSPKRGKEPAEYDANASKPTYRGRCDDVKGRQTNIRSKDLSPKFPSSPLFCSDCSRPSRRRFSTPIPTGFFGLSRHRIFLLVSILNSFPSHPIPHVDGCRKAPTSACRLA